MPILNVQLDTSRYAPEALNAFMQQATDTFAETLGCPKERIRVYLRDTPAHLMCVGGAVAEDEAVDAPFFEFFLLQGRPPEHRDRLLVAFTQLLVDCLGIEKSVIRGYCCHVPPEDWTIAGVPAGNKRSDEIAARKARADA